MSLSAGTPVDRARIDAVCDRWERDWKAGLRPPIEGFLGGTAEPERSRLLDALLRLELGYRFDAGERPTRQDFGRRFPAHGGISGRGRARPFALTWLVRNLQWPQLVRPFALTLVALGLEPLYLVLGWVLAVAWTGNVPGVVNRLFWYLVPMYLILLEFSLFLARTAWLSDRQYRLLVPRAEQHASLRRTIVSRLSLAGSLGFAPLLAGYATRAGFVIVGAFRLPTAIDRSVADEQRGDRDEARRWYDRAVAWMQKNKPEDAELRRFRAEAAGVLGLPDPRATK